MGLSEHKHFQRCTIDISSCSIQKASVPALVITHPPTVPGLVIEDCTPNQPYIQLSSRPHTTRGLYYYLESPAPARRISWAAKGAPSSYGARTSPGTFHFQSLTCLSWLTEATRPELEEARAETRPSCAATVMLLFSSMSQSSRDCGIYERKRLLSERMFTRVNIRKRLFRMYCGCKTRIRVKKHLPGNHQR